MEAANTTPLLPLPPPQVITTLMWHGPWLPNQKSGIVLRHMLPSMTCKWPTNHQSLNLSLMMLLLQVVPGTPCLARFSEDDTIYRFEQNFPEGRFFLWRWFTTTVPVVSLCHEYWRRHSIKSQKPRAVVWSRTARWQRFTSWTIVQEVNLCHEYWRANPLNPSITGRLF